MPGYFRERGSLSGKATDSWSKENVTLSITNLRAHKNYLKCPKECKFYFTTDGTFPSLLCHDRFKVEMTASYLSHQIRVVQHVCDFWIPLHKKINHASNHNPPINKCLLNKINYIRIWEMYTLTHLTLNIIITIAQYISWRTDNCTTRFPEDLMIVQYVSSRTDDSTLHLHFLRNTVAAMWCMCPSYNLST